MSKKLADDHDSRGGSLRRAGAGNIASLVVFRGDGLGDKVNDTDPQALGVKPLEGEWLRRGPRKQTAKIVNAFAAKASPRC